MTALVIEDEGHGLLLLRYRADGERLWTALLDVGGRPDPTSAYPGSLVVDSDGHAYVAGAFRSGGGFSDAGFFLVGREGGVRWSHAVPARDPGVLLGMEPRLDLSPGEDLYLVAPERSLLDAGPYYEAPVFAFATLARFDRASLPATEDGAAEVPRARLFGPHPNPTRGSARITLLLPQADAHVRVEVVDVLGRRVAVLHEGPLSAGEHRLTFDGDGLAPGAYVVRAVGEGLDVARWTTLIR